jgi:peptidoglycan lytic transglycosylase
MIRRTVQHLALLALLAGLAACAGNGPGPSGQGAGHGMFKIGQPYEIDGTWYYPAQDWSYNETGIASWYGKEFDGKYTANGEVFDLNALTAAHRTLPMPSIVQVTNLENGRSIELRVNDRGPYARGRIIDVSRRAAQLLGFEAQGTAKVRVKILVPETIAAESAAQRGVAVASADPARAVPVTPVVTRPLTPAPGVQVASTAPAPAPPPRQLAAAPAPAPPPDRIVVMPVKPTQIFIQAGAYAVAGNAMKVKSRLAALGAVEVTGAHVNGIDLYRVRLGPIGSVDEADKLLDRVIGTGLTEARIIVD